MSNNIYHTLSGAQIKKLLTENKLSLQELDTAALQKLFDYEIAMLCTDESDMEMLNACTARLDELNGPLISKEEFLNSFNSHAPAKKPARCLCFKKAWLVAAMIAIITAAVTVTATAVDISSFEFFREIIGMGPGGTINRGGVTLEYIDVKEEYDTVEEALQSKNVEILYPSVFPEGITLNCIEFSSTASAEEIINFTTNDTAINIYVERNADLEAFDSYKEEFKIEDCTFYIFDDTVTSPAYYAVCFYGDYYYCITANSYEDIIMILSGLKKS